MRPLRLTPLTTSDLTEIPCTLKPAAVRAKPVWEAWFSRPTVVKDRVLGIPVIDIFATYSFAKAHPYWTAFEIVVLVALVWFVVWFSRKFPMHMGKLRLGMFAVYVAVALPMLWVTFNTEPSLMCLLMDDAHQAELKHGLDQALTKTPAN